MSALKKSNLLVHVFKEAHPKFSQFFSETMIIIDQNHWMSIRLTCTLIQIYRHHSLQYLFIIISIMYTYGVCWSFVSFLMLAEMSGDGSMSCLSFDGLAIGANQYTGHHPERSKAYENQQQVHICSCICNFNVRVNVQHWTSTRSKLHSKSPTLVGADTYPELQSRTGHLHRSSYTPRQILPQTSLRRRPCRQSDGAHTKSFSPQRPFGIAWSTDVYDYLCVFNLKNMCRYMYILFPYFF